MHLHKFKTVGSPCACNKKKYFLQWKIYMCHFSMIQCRINLRVKYLFIAFNIETVYNGSRIQYIINVIWMLNTQFRCVYPLPITTLRQKNRNDETLLFVCFVKIMTTTNPMWFIVTKKEKIYNKTRKMLKLKHNMKWEYTHNIQFSMKRKIEKKAFVHKKNVIALWKTFYCHIYELFKKV